MKNKVWSKSNKFTYNNREFTVTGVDEESFFQTDFTRTWLRYSDFSAKRGEQVFWVDSIMVNPVEKKK